MSSSPQQSPRSAAAAAFTRRGFLRGSLGAGAALTMGSGLLAGCGGDDSNVTKTGLDAYRSAGIDWKQAKGATINIAVIPATYFTNLIELFPQFEKLTGVKVTAEQIPPQQIRKKVVLDLSTKGKQFHTHAADPMYYPLYAKNKWITPLASFLDDDKLTDPDWFDLEDIIPQWRESATVDDKLYAIPYDGEVTLQVYRTDLYKKAGLKPAETLEEYAANAKELNNPDKRIWGAALRGQPGAGQNMYIYPSLFREFGGEWFDEAGKPTINSDAGVEALTWYVDLLTSVAPKAVTNWNWPDIADAFAQGTLGSYIDAHSSAAVLLDRQKSVVVDKLGFARWPAGPTGKRVTSIWNWGFPINGAVPRKEQIATWLFIQWAASTETQIRTSYAFGGDAKRSGVNRTSLWESEKYRSSVDAGQDFVPAVQDSLAEDQDLDWRPRVPQWPAIGDRMAVAVQEALTGQGKPKEILDKVNRQVADIVGRG
ncbi:MAG: extracellular solute-binding protein [Micromonosporaceae bacterium]